MKLTIWCRRAPPAAVECVVRRADVILLNVITSAAGWGMRVSVSPFGRLLGAFKEYNTGVKTSPEIWCSLLSDKRHVSLYTVVGQH